MAAKSPKNNQKSGGSSIITRLFVLLILFIVGSCVWYWWQSNDPTHEGPPIIAEYVDVESIKRAPDVLTNVDWQGLSNRVATNLPWVDRQTNSPVVSTNQPIRPTVTNQVVRPVATNQPVVTMPTPVVSNAVPNNMVATGTRGAQTTLEAQVALARLGYSPGSIDGALGSQTRAAIRAFQKRSGLPQSGELDSATRNTLPLKLPLYVNYTVPQSDLSSLRPLSKTWVGKSEQDHLAYETILELVAEKFQSHPGFIKQLNKEVNWEAVTAGTTLTVPNVVAPKPAGRAAYASILLSARLLQVFDQKDQLIAQFPCSIAQKVDKRPIGVVRVKVVAENPNYRFNPEIFPESAEAKKIGKPLMIQPGPNNPVGVAWIGLDKPGYGIHGTPGPEAVGRTESHGCFRLANWNAAYLIKMVWVGMPVYVEP